MDSFGNSDNSSTLTAGQKQDVIEKVRQQIALANAQELIQKMSDKCFQKCISKPGASLDNYEQKCLAMCMDRYMDSWNLVSKTYSNRLKKEHGNL
ncbi:unnamed protein product [Gordionus sp. m RMFG-2023]